MGGLQGGAGKFVVFDYEPGSFFDRVSEAYAGPHDTLNSVIWYDAQGNIKAGVEGTLLGKVGEFMNYFNVLPATPFAVSTLTSPELLILLRQQRESKNK